MKGSSTSINLILTNCKHHFKHTHAFETGLSDFHKTVVTCFKNTFERLRPIYIQYRSYRNFDRNEFLSDLKNVSFEEALSSTNSEQAYEKFKELYSEIVDNHASLKQRVIRGNQAPFMSKDLSKQIMIRSRLRNKFNRHKTTQNWNAYKAQQNKCISIRRRNIRNHFSSLCDNSSVPTKQFWDLVKPFLNDKGFHGNENYTLLEKGKQHFSSTGRNLFQFQKAEPSDILKIIRGMKSNTSVGVDNISPKLVIMSAEVTAEPLTDLINNTMLDHLIFPSIEKEASVTPAFKKEDRQFKENYRPISVLNVFSKIFERFLLNQMLPFIDNLMSSFLSAYHSRYSTQHVLLRLIEQWRACLDENKVVGGILMDLSFDCLPHDLLIAKIEAYGVERNSLLFLMSYLKDRKQAVKIKGIRSLFQLIKSGVPQGSILGPILFNIFINDLYLVLQKDLHNFADDNTISAVSETIPELVDLLTTKSNLAIDWFNTNSMIVNPDKFKAIVLTKSRQDTSGIPINLKEHCITSENTVTLLGIKIDCRLSFEKHVSEPL